MAKSRGAAESGVQPSFLDARATSVRHGAGRSERQVDAVTSNMGHCLWAGIVDDDKAAAVAAHLAGTSMNSGFGLRTLAADMGAYNPMSYHNGSVATRHGDCHCRTGELRIRQRDPTARTRPDRCVRVLWRPTPRIVLRVLQSGLLTPRAVPDVLFATGLGRCVVTSGVA